MAKLWNAVAVALLLSVAPAIPQGSAAEGDWRKGRKVFRVCTSCHSFKAGEHPFGPSLMGVYGRAVGMAPGYGYSRSMARAREDGLRWTAETLDTFLMDPGRFIDGTRMRLPRLNDATDRANVIAYIKRRAAPGK